MYDDGREVHPCDVDKRVEQARRFVANAFEFGIMSKSFMSIRSVLPVSTAQDQAPVVVKQCGELACLRAPRQC